MSSRSNESRKEGGGFEELKREVVLRSLCTGCGACNIICPFEGVLEYDYDSGEPFLAGDCMACGLCLRVCPRHHYERAELERLVFDRESTPEEVFGIQRSVYVAKSTLQEVLSRCQDGGVATTLLLHALSSGSIEGAAISGVSSSRLWQPEPVLAVSASEVLENAGTRYSYSPNLIAYSRGVSSGLKRIAFVGTPCQILALRRIQKAGLKKYSKPLAFNLGLFCSECFSYKGLMLQKINVEMGIDLRKIVKMNIKGALILYLEGGEEVKIPLRDVKAYSDAKCGSCTDFSAELADVSLGGLGLNGWTLTIIRTSEGEKVFQEALNRGLIEVKPLEKCKSSLSLLERLSKIKRERAQALE